MRRTLIIVLLLILLALAGCAQKSSAPGAVENYLKAKVASDENKLVSLSCKAWEAQAVQDAAAFKSVSAEIKDMSCQEKGQDGKYTLVTCDGTLVIQYRGESPREQPLSGTTYLAVKEDGAWKMCGQQ
jgi:hypothetical protein